jgi:hypothetical protein
MTITWRNLLGLRRAAAGGARTKLIALTHTRNEDWVLGLSLRASLSYCDAVVVTDHLSSDRTGEILDAAAREFPDRPISVRRSEDREWREADARQEQLERARALGGSHFVIVDADEVPTANLLPRLRDLALRPAAGSIMSMPMISPYHCSDVYRWDGAWGEKNRIPWAFCDTPALHWKIGDGYQLHRRAPLGSRDCGKLLRRRSAGGLFHLQFTSLARLRCKAVWYKLNETLSYPGKRTPAQLNRMYDWTLHEHDRMKKFAVPDEWWAGYRERGWLRHYTPETKPWQLREIQRIVEAHGRERFHGLDFHDVV